MKERKLAAILKSAAIPRGRLAASPLEHVLLCRQLMHAIPLEPNSLSPCWQLPPLKGA